MTVLSLLLLLQRAFGAGYSARTLLVPLMLNNGSLEHVCGLNPLQEILISFGLKKNWEYLGPFSTYKFYNIMQIPPPKKKN